jgi:hypothetical protein
MIFSYALDIGLLKELVGTLSTTTGGSTGTTPTTPTSPTTPSTAISAFYPLPIDLSPALRQAQAWDASQHADALLMLRLGGIPAGNLDRVLVEP